MAEESNINEGVTAESKASKNMEIDLREEPKTQAYKEKMKIDIDNIKAFEKRNKVYTTKWSTIYEVIEPDCFEESDNFSDDF